MQIVIFGNMDLPKGSASATRCVAFAHLVKKCDYEPILLGVNYSRTNIISGTYEGIKYELIDFDNLSLLGRKKIRRIKELNCEIKKWINRCCTADNTKCIILFGVKEEMLTIQKCANKKGIPLIKDVVEWYDKNNFRGLSGLINYFQDRLGLYYFNVRCKNITAISKLLEHFYNKRGCYTLRIPTILDTKRFDVFSKTSENTPLLVAYAGSPAKKDYIANAVRAMLLLDEKERNKIELRLYGFSWDFLRNMGVAEGEENILRQCVKCFGRVDYEIVKEEVKKCDFTILLRPNKRYANAGFPTKVGESMSMGVPVISNMTSDLNLYLHDGVNGIICADETPESCALAYRKAISIPYNELHKMKISAREQAECSFDYRVYKNEFEIFLKNIT